MTPNDKHSQKLWYVVYTRSRAEKQVEKELNLKNIECFLPLQKRLRQWKDRKKWVEMPLISGYCFVHIYRKDYEEVLKTPNVVCYIKFEGKAAVVPDKQIESIKLMLKQFDFEVSVSSESFKTGKKVEVIEGPLMGLRGVLVEARGKNKFVLRIAQINSSFSVEIPASHLSALPEEVAS